MKNNRGLYTNLKNPFKNEKKLGFIYNLKNPFKNEKKIGFVYKSEIL